MEYLKKVKSQKYWTQRRIHRKVHNHMAKSNDKTHKKWMDNNCHIPDLVQAFSNVENGGLNLGLKP